MNKENRFEVTNKAVETLMNELSNIVDKKSLMDIEKKSLLVDILINFLGNSIASIAEDDPKNCMRLSSLILKGLSSWFTTFYDHERKSQTLQ